MQFVVVIVVIVVVVVVIVVVVVVIVVVAAVAVVVVVVVEFALDDVSGGEDIVGEPRVLRLMEEDEGILAAGGAVDGRGGLTDGRRAGCEVVAVEVVAMDMVCLRTGGGDEGGWGLETRVGGFVEGIGGFHDEDDDDDNNDDDDDNDDRIESIEALLDAMKGCTCCCCDGDRDGGCDDGRRISTSRSRRKHQAPN